MNQITVAISRFNTNDYTARELNEIFSKKINDIEWSIVKISDEWFENKKGILNISGEILKSFSKNKELFMGDGYFVNQNMKKQ